MQAGEVARIAALHVPGEGRLDIQRESGGLVNETYRVMRNGSAYSLRIAGSSRGAPGVDRTWEARVLECAAPAGLAPVPEYCDPQRGVLISRWVDGRAWDAADVRRRSGISRIAELARRIHALPLPAPARLMGPENWIDHYSSAIDGVLRESGTTEAPGNSLGRDTAAELRTAAARRLRELGELSRADTVLCHSDLHTLNLIDRGRSLVVLDWEYAHAADPFWDLAGWIANNDLDAALEDALLHAYAGRRPTADERRRLNVLSWLYDYVCLLWCELYLQVRDSAPGAAAGEAGSVAARARKLARRLRASASSRAD